MTPFQALVASLLESCVDYVRRDVDLQAARVVGEETTHSAHIDLVLLKDSWEAQERAIDHMIEVRALFLGEISIDYAFVSPEDWVRSTADQSRAEFVFAA